MSRSRSRGMRKGTNYNTAGLDQLGPVHWGGEKPKLKKGRYGVMSLRERQQLSAVRRHTKISLPAIPSLQRED